MLACLLHDIAIVSFIRCDHGYWGAQMIEPYVDEEVAWAVKSHQALRFFPDNSVGYGYPDLYKELFGPDYKPEPYIVEEYKRARKHKWYMTSRLICMNDIYSFDPNAKVNLDDFVDIIGRNFKQPKEGLGLDDSPRRICGARSCGRRGFCEAAIENRRRLPPVLTALDRPNSYIGRSVPRPNLQRLTQGRGQYVSDVVLPRMAHVAFVRSPHAHARIRRSMPPRRRRRRA